ncbi:hypothetical protein [Dasania marina]|uniref:hypothetical protein n=1 Tax=Dasania marina TaxID=471499 RepID=UPI00037BAA4A|nr:hypothetical protein [Dasania marina]
MENALFGLGGIILGAFIAIAKDWWFTRRSEKKDLEYLAIQVSCMLENFALVCEEVAFDDGLHQGLRTADGCKSIQVAAPEFDPERLDVVWQSLPSDIMYKILNLPNEIRVVNRQISDVTEHVSGPPDYEEVFEARTIEYGLLGIKVMELVSDLRKLAQLPKEGIIEHDICSTLKQQIEKTESIKAERSKRNAEFIASIRVKK